MTDFSTTINAFAVCHQNSIEKLLRKLPLILENGFPWLEYHMIFVGFLHANLSKEHPFVVQRVKSGPTLFEKYPKCLIWISKFLAFFTIFCTFTLELAMFNETFSVIFKHCEVCSKRSPSILFSVAFSPLFVFLRSSFH